ncbi:OLC1v1001715C1 [Oldenlandia corymbosa var. corymbosa]|uniref:OLC1v1001715C1 n=1 Tax=Oldenlandia corymbosa var. corymbosa TaxID=529605 RepID=A0AAV1D6L8_OLDCO|nr:OLC1v1001715C1 [Oldenlandia corymbosa var. corymbosa]
MASLTPGILQKLLQNVGNKDAKVVGEHRSALLQVIGIVPSLDDDPWKSRGFYLRVSDSLHSAYVSVLAEDVELIMSDQIQLGQFIHVTRLDPCSPVPVLCGLKPVPKRRPCVGDPKDLISSDALTARKTVESKTGKRCGGLEKKVEVKENLKEKTKRLMERDDVKSNYDSRRLSLSNGKVTGPDIRRLSLDSVRKGWDRSPGGNNAFTPVSKSKSRDSPCGIDSVIENRKHSSKEKTVKQLLISPLKSKNVMVSPKPPTPSKCIRKDLRSSENTALPAHLKKEDPRFRNQSEPKILRNSVPDTIHNLGREVRGYRNASFSSAVHAMEEASAAEGVIRCMSKFAELCESSEEDAAGPLVEQFLNLHDEMKNVAVVIKALVEKRILEANSNTSCSSQHGLSDMHCNFADRNALAWVQAAVETDLSKFSLLRKEQKKAVRKGEKCIYLMIENSPKKSETEKSPSKIKKSPGNYDNHKADLNLKKSPTSSRVIHRTTKRVNVEREEWLKGNGLKDAAELSEKLLSYSREWFLNYMEKFLVKGSGRSTDRSNSETASLLGHLKRVNKWLDDSIHQDCGVDDRLEDLKKKLYGFLLDNVDTAIQAKR